MKTKAHYFKYLNSQQFGTNRSVIEIAFVIAFGLELLVPTAWWVQSIGVFGAWILLWTIVSGCLVLAEWPKERSGFLLIVVSLLLYLGGIAYCKKVSQDDLWLVDQFAQLMFFIGSGVGVHFMAMGFAHEQSKTRKLKGT